MPASISILLIGASGVLGAPILDELLRQRSSFTRIAILASSQEHAKKFTAAKASGVDIVIGSYLSAESYANVTHVISCVGNALMPLQPAMIVAAITAGVTHFYPSEWNSDISAPEICGMRYFRDKQVTRSFLAAKAKETPGFQYTLMITGIFTEWTMLEFYGFDHEKHTALIYGEGDQKRIGVTSIRDIARYTVDSLLIPFEGAERTLRVQGWTGTLRELIKAYEEAKGVRYQIDFADPREAAAKQEEARLAGDDVMESVYSIKPLLAGGHGVADGAKGSKVDNGLFQFVPETPAETFGGIFRKGV